MIETERLVLSPHSVDRLAGYVDFWSAFDPEGPGAANVRMPTGEETWARMLRFIGHWVTFGFGPFIVIDKATNCIVGEVGLAYFRRGHGPDFDEYPEAMWKIHHRFQGRGVATEATAAALAWFDSRRIANRSVCMIDQHNAASLRIAALSGFESVRTATYRDNPVILFQRLTNQR